MSCLSVQEIEINEALGPQVDCRTDPLHLVQVDSDCTEMQVAYRGRRAEPLFDVAKVIR